MRSVASALDMVPRFYNGFRRSFTWGCGMDPITMAAGTALVGAMATDAWQHISTVMVSLWRRAHPERVDDIGQQLELLRSQVLAARHDRDADTEQALAGAWRLRLQQLLGEDPALAGELERLLSEELTPALSREEQSHVRSIVMTAHAEGGSHVIQAGGNVTTNEPPRQ